MSRAGFVLVGGRSSRMGRDKALLPFQAGTLVEHVARQVRAAAGSVCLVGPQERYAGLPYPIIPDRFPGCGPVAGIHAALASGRADWNLVTACDMPRLTPELLAALFVHAERAARHGAIPVSAAGRCEPLCAVYHRACLPVFERALREGRRKLSSLVAELDLATVRLDDDSWSENWNTPADCRAHWEQ